MSLEDPRRTFPVYQSKVARSQTSRWVLKRKDCSRAHDGYDDQTPGVKFIGLQPDQSWLQILGRSHELYCMFGMGDVFGVGAEDGVGVRVEEGEMENDKSQVTVIGEPTGT